MKVNRLAFWNAFAIAYVVLALLILTLIPFDFTWDAVANQLEWKAEFIDIVQNLSLFFPLGVVLANALETSLAVGALSGALLSTGIEMVQLFDAGRSSNYCDIVTNTVGAAAGIFFHQKFIKERCRSTLDISMVFSIIPLCWIIGMRSVTQGFMAWFVLPWAFASLLILKSTLTDRRSTWFVWLVLLVLCVLPVECVSRKAAALHFFGHKVSVVSIVLVIMPLVASKFPLVLETGRFLILKTLVFLTALILMVDIRWFLRKDFPFAWTVAAHFHWVDSVMSVLLLVLASGWHKSRLTR